MYKTTNGNAGEDDHGHHHRHIEGILVARGKFVHPQREHRVTVGLCEY